MSASSDPAASVPSLRRTILRGALLAGVLAASVLIARLTPVGDWLQGETLTRWLTTYRSHPLAPPLFIAAFTVFGVVGFPVSPLMVAGAVVFGFLRGWALNFTGALAGALAAFFVGRWLGGDTIRALLGPRRTERLTEIWERHGFGTLFRARLLPIPFPMINYGAALVGTRPRTYVVASALGLAVGVGIYTYLFDAMFRAALGEGRQPILRAGTAIMLMMALSFLPGLLRRRRSASG